MIKKFILSALSALMIFVLPLPLAAKVTVIERTKYFSVSGKTGAQIHAQIRRRAPIKLRRNRWIAATFAKYNYRNVKIGVRKKKCVATKTDFRLSLTYYYPRWTNKKSGSKNLQRQWDIFSKELVRHERIHGRIFRETLAAIERELRRTSGKAVHGCKQVWALAERRVRAQEKKGDARHAAFDRRENRKSSKVSKIERAFIKAR